MNSILRPLLSLVVLAILAVAWLPSLVAAQGTRQETVTVLVSFTTPVGNSIIGTLVARRTCGTVVTTELSFNGMLNGAPATATGTVIERWLGNGREEVEVTSTDWHFTVLGRAALRKFNIVQVSSNLISVDGVPVAIDGALAPPCSGRTTYTLTNPGQGTRPITALPNTGGEATGGGALLFHPAAIVVLLVGAGCALILAGRRLRPRARRVDARQGED